MFKNIFDDEMCDLSRRASGLYLSVQCHNFKKKKAIDTHMVKDHIFVFGPLVACLIEGRVHGCKYSQLISQILVGQWVV